MKKKILAGIVGLSLLASSAFAKNLEFSVYMSNDNIIQVANKDALKNYDGDIFFNYREENGQWILDKITQTRHHGQKYFKREFVRYLKGTEEIPTYVEGMDALYLDSDKDEELMVAVFKTSNTKTQLEWIDIAKNYITHLHKFNSEKD